MITTAAAPPSPTTLARAERMGFSIVHVYGLTETYGPYSVCQWQRQWDGLDPEQRARLRARQGVGMIQAERMRVVESSCATGSSSTCRPTARRWARSSCAATTS